MAVRLNVGHLRNSVGLNKRGGPPSGVQVHGWGGQCSSVQLVGSRVGFVGVVCAAGNMHTVRDRVRAAVLLESGRVEVITLNPNVTIREQTAVQLEVRADSRNLGLDYHLRGLIGSARL